MFNRFIFQIFLIIISIGLVVVYVNPTYKEIKNLNVENSEYSTALNTSKELGAIRDQKVEIYNSFTSEDLEKLKKMLPDTVDNVRLVMDINNLALSHDIVIKDTEVHTSDGQNQGKSDAQFNDPLEYGFVTLDFSFTASYDDFMAFISDIKSSLRLVDIVSLGMSTVDGEEEVYKYDLSIRTYWLE